MCAGPYRADYNGAIGDRLMCSPGLCRRVVKGSLYRVLASSELWAAAVCPRAVERLSVEERVRARAMPDIEFEPAFHFVACIPGVVEAWQGRLAVNCKREQAAAMQV